MTTPPPRLPLFIRRPLRAPPSSPSSSLASSDPYPQFNLSPPPSLRLSPPPLPASLNPPTTTTETRPTRYGIDKKSQHKLQLVLHVDAPRSVLDAANLDNGAAEHARVAAHAEADPNADHVPFRIDTPLPPPSSGDKAPGDCAVCYDPPIRGHDYTCLHPCGHVYHHTCLMRWLKTAITCPICRAPLTTVISWLGSKYLVHWYACDAGSGVKKSLWQKRVFKEMVMNEDEKRAAKMWKMMKTKVKKEGGGFGGKGKEVQAEEGEREEGDEVGAVVGKGEYRVYVVDLQLECTVVHIGPLRHLATVFVEKVRESKLLFWRKG